MRLFVLNPTFAKLQEGEIKMDNMLGGDIIMSETYFDYILLKSKKHTIKRVCKRYQLPIQLRRSMEKDWKEYKGITNDIELMSVMSELLRKKNTIEQYAFAHDSLDLYNRCASSFRDIKQKWYGNKKKQLNYNDLFNLFVDVCWLLASIQHSEKEKESRVKLLSNIDEICDSIKDYLEELYEEAIKCHNESVFIGEGIAAKREHKLFRGLYEYQYEQSLNYIHSNYTINDLDNLKEDYEVDCKRHLAVYYNLTITCGLAYIIIRDPNYETR